MDIRKAKENLRQSIHERIMKMPAHELAAESRSLCRRILKNLPPPPLAICGYYPLKTEADIRPLLEELLRRGDSLYLPSFAGNQLSFRKCDDLTSLSPGALNIPEPSSHSPAPTLPHIQYVLTPGRAFDREGYRLGRGNGGYDKWIKKQREENPSTQYWGIALECQIVNAVPHEGHDQKMNRVITARKIHPTI